VGGTRYTEGDGTIDRARELRRNSTPAEDAVWAIVRGGAIDGFKFRRQQRFGPFYADLICHRANLVIEVDGDSHAQSLREDASRTAFFDGQGYRVIRFSNADAMTNLDGVHRAIVAALAPSPSPSHAASPRGPLPLPHGGEGI
jgi:very-short-patch-repair endonuclease